MKIIAFGKPVSRREAIDIIIKDFLCNIVDARNTEVLEELLVNGWVGMNDWSDSLLEEFIQEICEENQ